MKKNIGELKRSKSQILFWGRSNKKYWPFSNFYPSPINLDGQIWPTVEHYYQAQKTTSEVDQKMIRLQSSAASARKLGQEVLLVPNWDEIKDEVMYKAVYAKFSQISTCRALLLSTSDAVIHEDSPHDYYWGWRNGGADKLGKILMRVREELRLKLDK